MNPYIREIQIRWSDLDPNFHIRHSAYYDWGAFCRIEYFNDYGLSPARLTEWHIGPILFREECIFRREIKMGDKIEIDLLMIKARKDFSRWSIQHHIRKEGVVAAILQVDGAWMDVLERKLATPPQQITDVFHQMPKAAGFEWI